MAPSSGRFVEQMSRAPSSFDSLSPAWTLAQISLNSRILILFLEFAVPALRQRVRNAGQVQDAGACEIDQVLHAFGARVESERRRYDVHADRTQLVHVFEMDGA